jgi:hypothetical protein
MTTAHDGAAGAADVNIEARHAEALSSIVIARTKALSKDGSRFPAVVSVTAPRDAQDTIIGYLEKGEFDRDRFTAEVRRATSWRQLVA